MPTYTIELSDIPEDTLRLLDARVQHQGGNRAKYLRDLLDKDLHSPTLNEILAPFRAQVTASGVGDEELDALFEETREEVWQERQGKPLG